MLYMLQVNTGESIDAERKDFIHLYSCSVKPVSIQFNVGISETINFVVEFTPKVAEKMCADIRLSVVNNPFENTSIQLVGEGYSQDVTIDNINNPVEVDFANEMVEFQEENISGNNVLFIFTYLFLLLLLLLLFPFKLCFFIV